MNLKSSKKKRLLGILNNLFLDEYKDIYFKKEGGIPDLEQLFIEEQTKFSEKFLDTVTFYDEQTYKKMFK